MGERMDSRYEQERRNDEQVHIIAASRFVFHPIGSDEEKDVLASLHRLQETEQAAELHLLNYYKEVPVSSPAVSLRLSGCTLFCRTGASQARVIQFCGHTVLTSRHLQRNLYAAAHYDPDRKEVALSDFSFVEVLPEQRESVRVRMHIPRTVFIESGRQRLMGRLVDLSLGGCAVDVADRDLAGCNTPYVHLTIEMPLKEGQEAMTARVMARFLKVEQHDNLAVTRCIFAFSHERGSDGPIARFIALRQGEIIRELH